MARLAHQALLISATLALSTPHLHAQASGESAVTVRADSLSVVDSLTGRSGKLLARLVSAARGGPIRVLQQLFGDSAASRPGVYTASAASGPFSMITMLPFRSKQGTRLGAYHMGRWPAERTGRGTVPEGFIEITPANQHTRVSQHFMLRDFLTHDQQAVWPKYLVLSEALVDKLELIISDLQARGVTVDRVRVMSGFRTPQYNAKGVRRGGRASDSRHQYGDAADIFIDNDGNERMDDLDGNGRVDLRDTRVILDAVERVERAHPELAGGAGLYKSTRSHGPFVHVDVRGTRARWGV
ncbi:MAG: DUF882 domain-containing protein [Gemmatimonadaceae bacterium]|nr:DUF882 domain-containing protein [Gemmatimonadaceae bacterium]